ncbi:MAG TPA: hypothetical protein VHJ82_02760 [Actinomycetota bacterium]|nr:hypothetical protein [Actinomycetota bacterium]
MKRQQVLGVIVIVVATVALLVYFLSTGGSEPVRTFEDPAGDVVVASGEGAPTETALADILSAEVRDEGEELVFEARLGAPIPNKLKDEGIDLGWRLFEGRNQTWTLSFSLDIGPNVSLVSPATDFGSGTFDGTLPGDFEVQGDTLVIRIRPADVPNFPSEFTWRLHTALDGVPGDATSALAEDNAPDSGSGHYRS